MTSTIAVINWNSGNLLRTCIESLLATTKGSEIIVIDNASTDTSLESAESFRNRVDFICNSVNRGFAAAVNQAFQTTSSAYMLILNPDVTVLPGAVQLLEEFMDAHPRAGAVGGYVGEKYPPRRFPTPGRLILENLGLRLSTVAALYEGMNNLRLRKDSPSPSGRGREARARQGEALRREAQARQGEALRNGEGLRICIDLRPKPAAPSIVGAPSPSGEGPILQLSHTSYESRQSGGDRPPLQLRGLPVDQPAAAALLIRRNAYDEVEGFDEQFFPAWYEDVDFCCRIKEEGWEIFFLPAAEFVHAGGYSAAALGSERFLGAYYRNQLRYARKHFGRISTIAVRLSVAAGVIGRMIRRPSEAGAYGRVLLGALKGW